MTPNSIMKDDGPPIFKGSPTLSTVEGTGENN